MKKYIFPESWDISILDNYVENDDKQAEKLKNKECKKMNNASSENSNQTYESISGHTLENENEKIVDPCTSNSEYTTYLYGAFWLVEQISKKIWLYNDLLDTFNNNVFIVNEILSLAIFPYVSGKNYNRFAKW